MKEYNSIPKFADDGTLRGEQVVAFDKLDGQNFRARYMAKGHSKKTFTQFGSRHHLVDETDDQFGDAVRYFKEHYDSVLRDIVANNSGKNGIFNGAEEMVFIFEWYGNHSFAGFHQPGDEMKMALIDVFIHKKGYIEPKDFIEIFCEDERIKTPDIIYTGKLNMDFVNSIVVNDWTKEDAQYPGVKEGVVIKRSTRLPGQRLPMCKVKTKWWLDMLHRNFPEDKWKELE